MDLGLNDKVVLVTGGSGAIGSAIADAFSSEGARLAIGYCSNAQRADDLASHMRGKGTAAIATRIDQGDPESWPAAMEQVTAELGAIDVLVVNGVMWPTPNAAREAHAQSFATNVTGPMMLADAVLPAMRSTEWGRIVFISSDVVDQPLPTGGIYPATKSALEAAARVLAVREGRGGILTNVVRPGFTLTERAMKSPRLGQPVIDAEAAKTPTGRICTPADVASAITYLASSANGHVNGQILSVSGGRELTR